MKPTRKAPSSKKDRQPDASDSWIVFLVRDSRGNPLGIMRVLDSALLFVLEQRLHERDAKLDATKGAAPAAGTAAANGAPQARAPNSMEVA